jgi:hypothetical protein
VATRTRRQLWFRHSRWALAACGVALLALPLHGCTDAGCVRNSECGAGFECQAAVCVIKADGGQDGAAGGISEAGAGAGRGAAGTGGKAATGGAGGTSSGGGGASGGRGGAGGASGGRGSLGSPPSAGSAGTGT